MEENENQASSYGKRPIWQWVLIYLVVGGIIYGLIYYFAIANKGGYSGGNSGTSAPQQQNTNQNPSYP